MQFLQQLKKPFFSLLNATLVTLLCGSLAMARTGEAQEILNRKLSISSTQQSLKNVLSQIEKQADVRFTYSSTSIDTDQKVSANFKNERLELVLSSVLKVNHIGYEIIGQRIVLSRLSFIPTSPSSPNVQAAETISGKVGTNKGETMPGVSILVKGTTRGTITDVSGNFKINAKTGEILVISFLGYETKELVIKNEADVLNVMLNESTSTLSDVVVIGSRSNLARTDVDRPVPVDVITAKELRSTGQVEIGQQLQFSSPSFNSSKNGINGIAGYADPATLKGLSPDQMLVLVNGKRRHQFAAIQNNVTVGKGTVITDMNAIPTLALERMEILRDGAAAQYGSDAIAGIANMVLKKSVNTGTAQVQYGQTSAGDGGGYTVGMNYGFDLGKGASLNITGNWQDVAGTDRSDPYNPEPVLGGAYAGIYAAAAITASATAKATAKANDIAALAKNAYWGNGTYGSFRISKYGSNAMKSGQLFYNLEVPLKRDWTLYSFGGYSHKDIEAGAFLRTAIATAATSNTDIWPNGYNPSLPGTVVDYSTAAGLKRTLRTGWNLDFSTSYGYSYIDQNAKNSANASLGAASPKDFYAGRAAFGQSVTEANISKTMQGIAGTKSLTLALGGQYRVDKFTLTEGDAASYAVGPLSATRNKTPGSQGRVGIDIVDAGSSSRSNAGLYIDAESDITNKLLVAAALRFENYSDFGSNLSGKLASRLKLTDFLAVRGSINRGFRAPGLQQIANAASTSTVQSGVITATKQLPSSDPRLARVGIEDPKAETSLNYNLGITAQAGRNFLFTLDAYQIDIKDRIVITENLRVSGVAALKPLFPGFNEITFFTNAINTKTTGIDLVTSYKQNIGRNQKITASVALTFNKTVISNVKPTSSALQLDTKTPVILVDTISRALVETSQPHSKILISLGYQIGKLSITLRSTYFGEVTAWEKLTVPNPGTSNLHQAQTFAGKNIFDASASYSLTKKLQLTLGANNFTNVYPDRVFTNYASYTNGQVPYSRNVNQFGFNGAYYYGNLTFSF